ncbi:MAG: VWA domain-containing protein [bacterium]|nr:VWA domain-containing protein [bacterium]
MRLYSWPYLLLFLPALGYLVWFFFKKERKNYYSTIRYPDLSRIKLSLNSSLSLTIRKNLIGLKLLALFFLILSLARPQGGQKILDTEAKGIDIMLVLDISGTMQAEDFKPQNRLFVAKKVLSSFIKGRRTDRIGLVSFAGESYTACPLTLDYPVILDQLKTLKFGSIQDGTAIGMAIANAVNRLQYSKARNKIIILLTDGENNAGVIDPLTAAQAAAAYGIRVYTIGVGKLGGAPIPFQHPVFGKQYYRNPDGSLYLTKLDERTLEEIANLTDGKYYRATDSDTLKAIYGKIDKLEKTKIKAKQYIHYTESFPVFLVMGLLCLLAYLVLDNIIFIKVP